MRHRSLHERLERARVDRLAFVDVDRQARAASQAGVEEPGGILQCRAVGEGELHLVLGFFHFRSSTTPGAACRINARMRARVSSRQSDTPHV